MSLVVIAATASAALYWTPGACASSISNRDEKDWKVTIIEATATKDHVLAPSAVLEGVCIAGCVVRLNDNEKDEYELKGSDTVSIEDGLLYYDGPPAKAVPKAEDADRPFEPGSE